MGLLYRSGAGIADELRISVPVACREGVRLTINAPSRGPGWDGDQIPRLSRRSFIRAAGSTGLLGGLGALLAACTSTSTTTRSLPNTSTTGPSTTGPFPNASTTGPAVGGYPIASLTPVDMYPDGFTISDGKWPAWVHLQEDGTLLIEGMDFYYSKPPTGSIAIEHDTHHPVEYRGCRFIAYDQTVLHILSRVPRTRVTYCYFSGAPTSRIEAAVGSLAGNAEIDHCEFRRWSNPIYMARDTNTGNHWNIHDNYLHDPVNLGQDHIDGMNLWGDGQTDFIIRHNTVLNSQPQTSCINNPGATSNILITDNLMAGGDYTIYAGAFRGVTGQRVVGNYFSTRYWPKCGYFNIAGFCPAWGADGNEWSGNYWFDGPHVGALIAPPVNGSPLP
jgi:hypothetical protein